MDVQPAYDDAGMRRLGLLPLILTLAACGSSDQFGIPDKRVVNDCEHGGVEVRVGLNGGQPGMERTEDHLTFAVEVANNLREDIVVTRIRIDPTPDEMSPYQLSPTGGSFSETIPENEEHLFELPVTLRTAFVDRNRQTVSRNFLEVVVTVVLQNGDSYRCRYGVPAPGT